MRQAGINRAQTTCNHDGLVVTHLALLGAAVCRGGSDALLVLAEVAQQIGAAKFVVKRRTTQGAINHDLQRAGDMFGLAVAAAVQARDGKACKPRFGFAAAACCAFVADFATRARSRTRKRRNGGRVVVRFNLHQHVLLAWLGAVSHASVGAGGCHKTLYLGVALHDGGVVRVSHHGALGGSGKRGRFGVANHAKQGFVLLLAVDSELRIEDFVAAMLAVGLGKHHQLHIGGVALQRGKGIEQIVDFVIGQCQPPVGIGSLKRLAPCLSAACKHVYILQRGGCELGKEACGIIQRGKHALGHAVVQQGGNGLALGIGQNRTVEKILRAALNAAHACCLANATVAGNIGCFGCPGRYRAYARCDDDAAWCGCFRNGLRRQRVGLSICEQLLQGLCACLI